MKYILIFLALVFVGTTLAEEVKTQPADKKNEPEMQILFFINPHGRPCLIQLSILDEMKDKLADLATVKQVSTIVPEDRATYYKYGVRALPSLILVDNSGKEIKRFPPGIQSEKTILEALNSQKSK